MDERSEEMFEAILVTEADEMVEDDFSVWSRSKVGSRQMRLAESEARAHAAWVAKGVARA